MADSAATGMAAEPPDPGRRPRAGYLGPEGTFSEEALLAGVSVSEVEAVALASIYDTIMAVRDGDVDWAVVPIENSLEGSVAATLDLLAEESGAVRIAGESLLRVRHNLIAAGPVQPAEIQVVLTHPQVPGQCTRFLRSELAHAQVLPAASTAEAVRTVARDGDRSRAALGTTLAASIYGATVVREGVQDRDDNETRFVWLARREGPAELPPGAAGAVRKTSLVFWGSGAGAPGWLVRCLDEFAQRDINLTKIESRPRGHGMGSYMFFADLLGDERDGPVADAIARLGLLCDEVYVLGSYPAAAGGPR
jgi:prephenate dehydratase